MSSVGTTKIFEDECVVVWQFDLPPGEQCPLHTHQLDYVVRVQSEATLEVHGPSNELLYTVDVKPRDMTKFRMSGEEIIPDSPDRRTIPATHSVRNIGTTHFREVLVEFKE